MHTRALSPPASSPGCRIVTAAVAATLFGAAVAASASSHREAPFITEQPKVDATDFYMFRSYEPGREGYVTLIANYLPLQAPYGGPNYFTLDPDALYEIHVDNDGDGVENLTFQFRFAQRRREHRARPSAARASPSRSRRPGRSRPCARRRRT